MSAPAYPPPRSLEREVIGLCKAGIVNVRHRVEKYLEATRSNLGRVDLGSLITVAVFELYANTPPTSVPHPTIPATSTPIDDNGDTHPATSPIPPTSSDGPTPDPEAPTMSASEIFAAEMFNTAALLDNFGSARSSQEMVNVCLNQLNSGNHNNNNNTTDQPPQQQQLGTKSANDSKKSRGNPSKSRERSKEISQQDSLASMSMTKVNRPEIFAQDTNSLDDFIDPHPPTQTMDEPIRRPIRSPSPDPDPILRLNIDESIDVDVDGSENTGEQPVKVPKLEPPSTPASQEMIADVAKDLMEQHPITILNANYNNESFFDSTGSMGAGANGDSSTPPLPPTTPGAQRKRKLHRSAVKRDPSVGDSSPSPASNVKTFACPTCPSVFRLKNRLDRHIKSRHSDDNSKDYQCSECAYATNYMENLTRHRRNIHGVVSSHFNAGRRLKKTDENGAESNSTARGPQLEVNKRSEEKSGGQSVAVNSASVTPARTILDMIGVVGSQNSLDDFMSV